jgi:chromosome segregation ATPase
MVLSEAREALAARQQSHEKLLATLAEAEAENARATNDLNEAKAALAAQPANLKALREDVQRTEKMLDSAQIALKKAGKTAARNPEAETTVPLLLEKQNALKTAADRVQTAKNLLRAAGPRLAQLTAQIKPLTESAKSAAAKLQTAGAAAAESTRQLAAEKDRIAKLAVEYLSSK